MSTTTNATTPNTTSGITTTIVNAATLRKELEQLECDATVIGPEDVADYKANTTAWNRDVPGKPAALIRPKTTEDVCASVKAVASLGGMLVIAGGRHGKDCLKTNAIAIDMSLMKEVEVTMDVNVVGDDENDKEKTTTTTNFLVTVEGGCKLEDLDRACKPYKIACVTGTNPDTGVVGLSTLGGGGYLSRWYGLAADNFVSAEVVLASGEIVLATKDDKDSSNNNKYADLLWGLQGAGSNFGIVTKLTMKAHKIDMVFGGLCINVAPSPERARTVLENWHEWITSNETPRSVYSAAVLPCGAPVVPIVAVELDPAVVPQGEGKGGRCSLKNIPSLQKPFGSKGFCRGGGAFGSVVSIKDMKRRQYHSQMQTLLTNVQAPCHCYQCSCYVPSLSPEVIHTLVEFTKVKNSNNLAVVLIFPMNGRVSDPPTHSTSFWGGGRQTQGFWIIIEGKYKPDKTGKNRAAVVQWVKDLRKALSKFHVSDTAHTLHGNMEDSNGSAIQAIFGDNLKRLREVKAQYDPNNFWKCNRNVTPTAS